MAAKVLYYLIFVGIVSIVGCRYPLVQYSVLDNFNVSGKRIEKEEIDIRDFIKPAEAKSIVSELGLDGKSEEEKVLEIYKYVGSLKSIGESNDNWQYPCETIIKKGGDCEDKVFLLLSALIAAGVKDVYAVKGRFYGGGHFWVEYKDKILDPYRKKGTFIAKANASGYNPFFKFDDKKIFAKSTLMEEL